MSQTIINFFDSMVPLQRINVTKSKNPDNLIAVAKQYIDNGGQITFVEDGKYIQKNTPFPKGEIGVYIFY